MKREALNHTKMKRLCRRLDIPAWQGVGIMESLWHLTAREAPAGDIGKLSNEDIALGIDWRGEELDLIDALVLSGWVDRNDEFRLVIHDWDDHADDAVHLRLARAQLYFCSGRAPKIARLGGLERKNALAFYTPCARTTDTCALPEPEPRPSRTPPEPVPEPEPKQTPVLVNPKEQVMRKEFDEQWLEFEKAAKQFWPDLIPEDLSSMWHGYKVLDFEQKQVAIALLQERIDVGQDSRYVTKKYFDKGEWKRKPQRPAANTDTTRLNKNNLLTKMMMGQVK